MNRIHFVTFQNYTCCKLTKFQNVWLDEFGGSIMPGRQMNSMRSRNFQISHRCLRASVPARACGCISYNITVGASYFNYLYIYCISIIAQGLQDPWHYI